MVMRHFRVTQPSFAGRLILMQPDLEALLLMKVQKPFIMSRGVVATQLALLKTLGAPRIHRVMNQSRLTPNLGKDGEHIRIELPNIFPLKRLETL